MQPLSAVCSILCCAAVLLMGCVADPAPSDGRLDEAFPFSPDVTIGLIEGDSAYLFGNITSVAVDSAGRVYAADRMGATIRVYDASGKYLAQLARAGEGPGEISGWPADLTFDAIGRLYVRDGRRVTVFARRQSAGLPDSVAAIWPLPGWGNLASTRSRFNGSGDYYYPAELHWGNQPPRFFYLPFRNGKPTGDSLEVPSYPNITYRDEASVPMGANARMVYGLSHVPFAALPSWDVTNAGTLLSSDGNDYALIETNLNGDTLRTIHGPAAAPRTIPAEERADSARALESRLEALSVPIDRVMHLGPGVREGQLPRTLPAVIGINVAMDGSVWVEQWPQEGDAGFRYYDVLDPDGRFLRRVVLKAPLVQDPPPFFGTRHVVGVIRDPETAVERVVRFAIGQHPS